ncbi:GIY-YIG nuclease family protein [Peribacillus butanolivorans]|uniref:GIY-YIG nuclease family protein n=1 Tax=Peribacillus butanolivorans TaxID=421767 RepID=UPI0039FDDB9E
MKTITRVEAVERFGNDICKRHFKKNNTIKSIDIEYALIRTILQHYESVERAGIGTNTYYILGNGRPEPISWYKVKWSDVHNARKNRARTYPEEFYKNDTCTIYLATNKITNKIYVGSTKRPLARRISEHKSHAFSENSMNFNTDISKAIRKYGFDAFKWEVIRHWDDEETLKEAEDYWIRYYRAIYRGYNSRWSYIEMNREKHKNLC